MNKKMQTVSHLAFVEAGSREDVAKAVRSAIGPANINRIGKITDTAERQKAIRQCEAWQQARRAYIAGRMGRASCFRGSETQRIKTAMEVLDLPGYGGTGKADKRRTKPQENAYGAAREWWSKLTADIGIGTAKTTTEANKSKRGAQSGKAKSVSSTDRPTVEPTGIKTKAEFEDYIQLQASALLATLNKTVANKVAVRPALSSAIEDFNRAVKAACK